MAGRPTSEDNTEPQPNEVLTEDLEEMEVNTAL